MDKRTAEEELNRLTVELEKWRVESAKEIARESKLRADLVQAQLDVYVKALEQLDKQSPLAVGSLTGKNWPFSS